MMPESSKKYHYIKNWLFLASIFLSLLGLYLLLVSGLSMQIKNFILRFFHNNFLVVGSYILIINIGYAAIDFPLALYEGFVLEHRFKLSNQKFLAWFSDLLKKHLIEFAVFLPAAESLYIFLRRTQDSWWIYAALFWILLSIILAKITPGIIIPLFFKISPLKDEALREKVLSLVKNSGSAIKNIFVIDFSKKTKKSNALVCGLGKNRRILLADNLINEFSPDEIAVVVAHELGHEVHKDTLRLLLSGSISSFLAFFFCNVFLKSGLEFFGFDNIHDIAAFPVLALSLFLISLTLMPLQNAYTRKRERAADLVALKLSQDKDSFISMMEKLGKKNLADLNPNKIIEFLLYDHPPISKRIAAARKFYST
ncbi:MAG: hypothetical protein COV72_07935 [Candidatus Omnitrophica bacterium CG11_big_fil_rev_8_21_14_0_20_42_13]|uniref:Peptidase n=1 Tax=Candidatus Ghiorseimicrobium undicola TaxID=1974746 RepID=A0A2H0LW17_9BACT|nr:MAG: hypothetical protein COV72_07935 [Candidatus Omnitrophica bacterium CG11_big_fil_rev_8_21_14_0_20_42_13]